MSTASAAKRRMSLESKKSVKGFLFVLPIVIGLIAVYLPAIFQSIQYSFGSLTMSKTGFVYEFIGWQNYVDAFMKDANYRQNLVASLQNMAIDVPIIIMFSFFMATLLNQKFHGSTVVKVIFFLPVIIATGIISQSESSNMIIGMYSSGSKLDLGEAAGVFNYNDLKNMLYMSPIPSQLVDLIVGAIDRLYIVITSSGVQLLIFSAGLQSMPVSMFEAAKVEGASGWETFWKISFPYISPLIMLNVIYTIIDSFLSYRNAAVTYINQIMKQPADYAFACSLSWIYVAVVAVIIALVWLLINKLIVYQD